MEPSVQSNIPNEPVLSFGNKPWIFNPKIFIPLIIALVVFISALAYYSFSQKVNLFQKPIEKLIPGSSTSPVTLTEGQNKEVAKVGQEIIYQSDLDTELTAQPSSFDPNIKALMLQKIASDSVILQGAREIALVKLDESVFNSKNKDYAKRIKLVKEAKEKVENEADNIEGTVISVWFLNGPVGPLGYDKSKQIALEKITKIYADVKAKKITIQQAGEAIKNDSSLEQIDKAYKTNASFTFKINHEEPVTRDEDFNSAILNLKEGQLTNVLVGNSVDQSGSPIQSHYHFAQLIKRNVNEKFTSFENWLEKVRKAYAVTYY